MTTTLTDPAPPPVPVGKGPAGGPARRAGRARFGVGRALGIGLIWLFVAVSLLLLRACELTRHTQAAYLETLGPHFRKPTDFPKPSKQPKEPSTSPRRKRHAELVSN